MRRLFAHDFVLRFAGGFVLGAVGVLALNSPIIG